MSLQRMIAQYHRRVLLRTLIAFALAGDLCAHAATTPRPNIIIILADDLGWSDIGCYGGEIQTPNLDALAKSGVSFTQFCHGARCCPTRASLLTGLYPHQAGVGSITADRGPEYPGYRGTLQRSTVTLARMVAARLRRSMNFCSSMTSFPPTTRLFTSSNPVPSLILLCNS